MYLLEPEQGLVVLLVHRLQVFDSQFLVQHALVEGQREAAVYELPMVQGLKAHHHQQHGTVCATTTEDKVNAEMASQEAQP